MKTESLGLIETLGLVPAIEAADAGAKTANVTFRGYQRARAGLITVVFVGDVAAVRAAVTAGAAAAYQVGKVISMHVIARPNRQLHVASTATKTFQPGIALAPAEVGRHAAVWQVHDSGPAPVQAPSLEEALTVTEAKSSALAVVEKVIAVSEPEPTITTVSEEIIAPMAEELPATATEGEITGEFGAGDSHSAAEEIEVAATVPARRKKEKARTTRSKRKA
jgi:ethanolamine utilization protein EutM